MSRPRLLLVVVALASFWLGGCLPVRLPLAEGVPVRGPAGSYTITPPSDAWERRPQTEDERIDLAVRRVSRDAWLNVSVLPGRFPTAEEAFADARARTDSILQTGFRDESIATVGAPGGDIAAHFGVYCGRFDRELLSRESCIMLLTTLRGAVTYALVGQVRIDGDDEASLERRVELESLIRSLRLVDRPGRRGQPGSSP